MDIRELIRLYYTDYIAYLDEINRWAAAGYPVYKLEAAIDAIRTRVWDNAWNKGDATLRDAIYSSGTITQELEDALVAAWDELSNSGDERFLTQSEISALNIPPRSTARQQAAPQTPPAQQPAAGAATMAPTTPPATPVTPPAATTPPTTPPTTTSPATTQQSAVGQAQASTTGTVAGLNDPRDYLQTYLENFVLAYMQVPGTTPEEVTEATLKVKEIEKLFTADEVATLRNALLPYIEQEGLISGKAITDFKKDQISTQIKKIVPAIIVDAMKGVGAVAQVYSGLQNLSEMTMPTPPELPQPSGELSEAMRIAQREAQQVDPRVQEARKRAALQTLMQGREAAITGSAGQAGSFAANMQQNLINVNAELQKGIIADEQMRQQAQGQYNQLVGQQLRENEFRKQYEMGIFDRNYREAAARRTGQEGLVATGLSNLSNLSSGIATNIALANYYKDLRSQLNPPPENAKATEWLEGIRKNRASLQGLNTFSTPSPFDMPMGGGLT